MSGGPTNSRSSFGSASSMGTSSSLLLCGPMSSSTFEIGENSRSEEHTSELQSRGPLPLHYALPIYDSSPDSSAPTSSPGDRWGFCQIRLDLISDEWWTNQLTILFRIGLLYGNLFILAALWPDE